VGFVAVALGLGAPLLAQWCPPGNADEISVYRDEHGFPHIEAASEEGAYYGLGYMQALDLRAELLLKLAFVSGRANASFSDLILNLSFPGSAPRAHRFGPDHLPLPTPPSLQIPTLLDIDKTMIYYRYVENAERIWRCLGWRDRRNLERFTQGINDAIRDHHTTWVQRGDFRYPELDLLGLFDFEVRPTDVIQNTFDLFTAFAMDDNQEKADALINGEISSSAVASTAPSPPPGWPHPGGRNELPGRNSSSNQWAFRSIVNGEPQTSHVIDPHLPLFDIRFMLYSFQLRYPGGMAAGATVTGFPFMITGTTDHLAWSHTAHRDTFKSNWLIRLDPQQPSLYETYQTCGSAPFREETHQIANLAGGFDEFKTFDTTHGRLLARAPSGDQGLTFRVSRDGCFDVVTQYYSMARARGVWGGIWAMAQLGLPTYNTVLTDACNIYFVYNALLARRDDRFDWTQPVDAMDPRTDWGRLHRFWELPQVLNPDAGYLINSNVSPTEVTDDPGFTLAQFPRYMVESHTPILSYRHQSARRVVAERFHPLQPLTRTDLFEMATDTRSYYYVELLEKLQATLANYSGGHPPFPDLTAAELAAISAELSAWASFAQGAEAATEKANTIQPRMEVVRFLLRLAPEFESSADLERLAQGDGNYQSTEIAALSGLDGYRALRTVLDMQATVIGLGWSTAITWGETHVLDNFVARFPINGGGFALRSTGPNRFDGQFVMDTGQAWVQTVEHPGSRCQTVESFFQKPVWGPLDPLVPWINENSINFSNDEFKDFRVAPGAIDAGTAIETRLLTMPPLH